MRIGIKVKTFLRNVGNIYPAHSLLHQPTAKRTGAVSIAVTIAVIQVPGDLLSEAAHYSDSLRVLIQLYQFLKLRSERRKRVMAEEFHWRS